MGLGWIPAARVGIVECLYDGVPRFLQQHAALSHSVLRLLRGSYECRNQIKTTKKQFRNTVPASPQGKRNLAGKDVKIIVLAWASACAHCNSLSLSKSLFLVITEEGIFFSS